MRARDGAALQLVRFDPAMVFTSGSCLLVYKYYLQKGEGGAVNES